MRRKLIYTLATLEFMLGLFWDCLVSLYVHYSCMLRHRRYHRKKTYYSRTIISERYQCRKCRHRWTNIYPGHAVC